MDSLTPEALAALIALGPAALWLMVVSFALPPVIAIIQQTRWSARVQSVVAFVVYLVVAAVWAFLNGIFSAASFIVAALVVFVIAGNSYKLLWKPTGVALAIETATTKNSLTGEIVEDTIAEHPEPADDDDLEPPVTPTETPNGNGGLLIPDDTPGKRAAY